jgi:hypothetical protein
MSLQRNELSSWPPRSGTSDALVCRLPLETSMRWALRRLPYVCPLVLGGAFGLIVTGLFSSTLRAQSLLPGVSILAPSVGTAIFGTVTVSAAADGAGLSGLQFQVNGTNLGPQITSGSCSAAWDTTTKADGDYALVAIGSDGSGNTVTSSPVTVTVSNAGPTISAVGVSNIVPGGATVSWTTDQASGTQVDYGTTAIYGTSTTLDSTLVTQHAPTLTGLAASTTYHFRVRSWNALSHVTTSGDFVFTTTAGSSSAPPGLPTTPPSTAAPQISGVTVFNISTSSAFLTWTTNQVSDSEVDYGPTANYGMSTSVDANLVTNHSETLVGLSPGTTYHFRVGSWNVQGVLGVSGDFVFTTATPPAPPPPPPPSGTLPKTAPPPPPPGGNSCTTPDPFVVLGGGTCSGGGWRPPFVPVPSPPSGGSGTCVTPDPFAILGGGTCTNGGWRPPATVVTPGQPPTGGGSSCLTPDPFAVLGGGVCVSGGWRPPAYGIAPAIPTSSTPGGCTTPDPFGSLGGGTCANGGWKPPTIVLITSAGTSAPVVNRALCTTPNPFTNIQGLVGACINGGWVPVIRVGGGL